MIGIRQADGSFYEIMGDAQTGRKRLVLSAARTDQHGVRIDLYRSVDGTLDEASSLGSIALDDTEGLGYQDIEFLIDLDDEGQLEASAALPGQPPRTLTVDLSSFRGPRTDADMLGDDSLTSHDLDTLDEFALDPEPMVLDLPEPETEPEPRTDAEILGDEDLASVDLDNLDDFSFDSEPASTEDEVSKPLAPDSFDLGDLDAGFAETPEVSAEPAEDWEKISLDDMESMEFMDTGDEISSAPTKPSSTRAAVEDHDDFSFDDHPPLELGDLDSDLSDLPDLDESPPSGSLDDLDQDFLAPPELTDSPDWDIEAVPEPLPLGKPGKAPKEAKPPKVPRAAKAAREPRGTRSGSTGGLDKTALFLSLITLSLLVVLILVLLFLNMIKAPQVPAIQPEVMGWKPAMALASSRASEHPAVDLGSPQAASFEAGSALEVPEALKSARISLRLEAGDTPADAQRRFGTPARSQGNLLFW